SKNSLGFMEICWAAQRSGNMLHGDQHVLSLGEIALCRTIAQRFHQNRAPRRFSRQGRPRDGGGNLIYSPTFTGTENEDIHSTAGWLISSRSGPPRHSQTALSPRVRVASIKAVGAQQMFDGQNNEVGSSIWTTSCQVSVRHTWTFPRAP